VTNVRSWHNADLSKQHCDVRFLKSEQTLNDPQPT
jgi:hypothetical protein